MLLKAITKLFCNPKYRYSKRLSTNPKNLQKWLETVSPNAQEPRKQNKNNIKKEHLKNA